MGKRGHNEGSIYKRSDGRWVATITLGYEKGQRKRKSYYGETRKEVQEQLTRALRAQQQGLPVSNERQTIQQYLSGWLTVIKPTLRASAWHRYEEITRLHLLPAIGKLPLAKLSAQHLNQLYAEKLESGLSPTTVRYIHIAIHKALQAAERLDLVPRNVADLATAPRRAKPEMSVWNPAQARAFLDAARGDRLEALYVLALTTTMREGELLSLKWKDVSSADVEHAHLIVRSSVRRQYGRALEQKGVYIFSRPKTEHGRRKVALTPDACRALNEHRIRQNEERAVAGQIWQETDLVFCDTLGGPLHGISVYRYQFLPLVHRAGVPYIRFHDLRHTSATLMLLSGVPVKVVSEMLGHSSIAITLDVYAHVLPEMQRQAVQTMQRLLGE
jgi:integrase